MTISPPNPSLRGRVALATFVPLVLFGLLAGLVGVRALRATAEDLALRRQTALARVAAGGVASNLQAGVRALELTARDLGDQVGQPERQQEVLLERIWSLGAFSAVVLVDEQGRPVATAPPGFATTGFAFAEQPFFRAARALQSPVFSGVFHYDPTGLPVAAAAVPVRGRGGFAGALIGGFSLARPEWARDLNLVRSPDGAIAYLVDAGGTVVYRPGGFVPGESIRFDPELWHLAGAGAPGGLVYRFPRASEEVVATYAPVGTTGWGLLIEEPWRPIVASIAPAQLLVAGLLGLGMRSPSRRSCSVSAVRSTPWPLWSRRAGASPRDTPSVPYPRVARGISGPWCAPSTRWSPGSRSSGRRCAATRRRCCARTRMSVSACRASCTTAPSRTWSRSTGGWSCTPTRRTTTATRPTGASASSRRWRGGPRSTCAD